jgi:hypothetical protein
VKYALNDTPFHGIPNRARITVRIRGHPRNAEASGTEGQYQVNVDTKGPRLGTKVPREPVKAEAGMLPGDSLQVEGPLPRPPGSVSAFLMRFRQYREGGMAQEATQRKAASKEATKTERKRKREESAAGTGGAAALPSLSWGGPRPPARAIARSPYRRVAERRRRGAELPRRKGSWRSPAVTIPADSSAAGAAARVPGKRKVGKLGYELDSDEEGVDPVDDDDASVHSSGTEDDDG